MTKKTIGDYVTDITYNKAGLPKTYVSKYGTSYLNDYSYTYRTDGNRLSEYDSVYDVTKAYTYDGAGRLTNEAVSGTITKTSAYTYDKRGNRIGETVTGTENHTYVNTYDNNNRLLTSLEDMGDDTYEGTSYSYDKNGNQLQKNHVVAYEDEMAALYGEIFTYTVTNKLKTYRNNNGNKTASYTYKATGMRDTKTVAGVTTGYIWNGNNMVAETNSSGVIQNQYHYGVDGVTMAQLGTSTKVYLKDAHGNVVGTSDMGGLQDSYYIYDAFGNDLESVPNETNPFGYCGEYLDSESGLIYLRNRYYDTTTGRFISEDPIRDGLNWYSYCGGNPVMFVDPMGLELLLEGTGDQVQVIWKNIKEFSQDELLLTQLEDKNGNKIDTYKVTIIEKRDGGCNVGTELVRRLIDNTDKTCTVKMDYRVENSAYYLDSTAASNGTGSSSIVYFNPDRNPEINSVNPETGYVEPKKRPDFIGLAHEFIHAERAMRGVTIDLSITTSYKYKIGETTEKVLFWNISTPIYIEKENIPKEELATVGLKYNKPGDITENMIRKEHGLWERGSY